MLCQDTTTICVSQKPNTLHIFLVGDLNMIDPNDLASISDDSEADTLVEGLIIDSKSCNMVKARKDLSAELIYNPPDSNDGINLEKNPTQQMLALDLFNSNVNLETNCPRDDDLVEATSGKVHESINKDLVVSDSSESFESNTKDSKESSTCESDINDFLKINTTFNLSGILNEDEPEIELLLPLERSKDNFLLDGSKVLINKSETNPNLVSAEDVSESFDLAKMSCDELDEDLISDPIKLAKLISDRGSKYDLNLYEELRSNHESEVKTCNGFKESLFNNPVYKAVIQEFAYCKEKVGTLQSKVHRLEADNDQLRTDRSYEIYLVQLEALEKTISQQHSEVQKLREQKQQQAEVAASSYTHLKQDLESRLNRVTKQYEVANKEMEAMVMRYAQSEKVVIDLKREQELISRKLQDSGKEEVRLQAKLKGASTEKTRICQMLDNKCHELTTTQKEVERLKEELNLREVKIKWAQNKLRTELETHKETQHKLEKMGIKVQEIREEADQVKRDCQAKVRSYQESQENKAHNLDQQLKEQQARLIMERHERQDKEENHRQVQQEVDNLRRKHQLIIDENNLLSVKVQSLEKERLEYEQNLSRLKTSGDKQRQDMVDLQAQLAEMESLRIQLQHEQERLGASRCEVERLRRSNAELQQDMAGCREREAELLNFTQKLTDKNVRLQSEFSATEAKAEQLEAEQGPLQRCISELEVRLAAMAGELEQESRQRKEEGELLARHLAERTQRSDSLALQLEDQKGENIVLQRRQAGTVKELTRELQQYKKRVEHLESPSNSNTSLGQESRTSSCVSLSAADPGLTQHRIVNLVDAAVPIQPDRQMLVERIVKLQHANARKAEKLDFLEEHSRQLLTELQRKTRIIQSYVMREQSGILTSPSSDRSKAELAKHKGIMASMYNSKAADSSMTLDLSLEINRKLQAVLEDTLLKNITLKENIETLGDEIARISKLDRK